ncbi:MAG: MogA/MoaB family molybdenum cofactor biosynthesis protein [Promethearchaeota archaeon]|jgi:molybdenum cofactor biosynthesis protein B
MKVHEEHKKKGPEVTYVALVIVSSSRFNELQEGDQSTDKTIPLIRELLEDNDKITLYVTEIVPDDKDYIIKILQKLLANSSIHSIIFSGGTGLTPKDITYETVEPLLEKEISGFGELFRFLSFKEIGASSMLSRATGGKIKDKAVFLLPGSPKAVELAFRELLIPELRHIVNMINKKEK